MDLEPIGSPHERGQVGEMCLAVSYYGAHAFLFHHRWEGAEPASPLLAEAISVQHQFSIRKASSRNQRIQHPFGAVPLPIQDHLEHGLKRSPRLMRDIVL